MEGCWWSIDISALARGGRRVRAARGHQAASAAGKAERDDVRRRKRAAAGARTRKPASRATAEEQGGRARLPRERAGVVPAIRELRPVLDRHRGAERGALAGPGGRDALTC